MIDNLSIPAHPALVARTDIASHAEQFLQLMDGETRWTGDPRAATSFASMREAIRMASRLPAGNRAYGLPADLLVAGSA